MFVLETVAVGVVCLLLYYLLLKIYFMSSLDHCDDASFTGVIILLRNVLRRKSGVENVLLCGAATVNILF